MKHVVVPGVLLGVLLGVWVFVMGLTGWYKHPKLLNLFWVVVLIQIVVLTISLRRSARDGGTYGTQVGRGVGIALVAGIIVIANSLLFTTVAFPQYFDELRHMQVQLLREAGRNDAEIKQAVDAMASVQTPLAQAIFGFIGTVMTGLVASLVIALFARGPKKQ